MVVIIAHVDMAMYRWDKTLIINAVWLGMETTHT